MIHIYKKNYIWNNYKFESDFCQTMLIFESTKTNTPIPQGPRPILKWQRRSLLCETKQTQRYSPRNNNLNKKQRNLGVRFNPFLLLEFSPPLERCSDIYAGLTSCLIVTLLLMFCSSDIFLFLIFHFSLSIIDLQSVLCTQIECSLSINI